MVARLAKAVPVTAAGDDEDTARRTLVAAHSPIDPMVMLDISTAESGRCNQAICDWADRILPEMAGTTSRKTMLTGHDEVI